MSGIHTAFVGAAHPYTHEDVPWLLADDRDALRGAGGPERQARWRLFHYLSGGGMSTFGRTWRQVRAERRRNRFLAVAGVLIALWLVLLVF